MKEVFELQQEKAFVKSGVVPLKETTKPVQKELTPRQRLAAVLEHKPTDKLCVDFGAGSQTGIGAGAVYRLREALLGSTQRVKIREPYQMLGEIDEDLRQKLGIDVVGVDPKYNMFGFTNEGSKPFDMPDGTPVLVPEDFNYTTDEQGNILMHPVGDLDAPPSAKMPPSSFFFDSINRQKPLIENNLNYLDNCEEFGLLSDDEVKHFMDKINYYYHETDYGIYLTLPATAFGDIALVPAPWMKDPKGIRDVEEWYISTVIRKDYIYKVFEKQLEFALKNIETLANALGDKVQAAFVSGTDFGQQNGPFISTKTYRELYKPFLKAVNDKIHELTTWKTFIHSCGSIYDLIPDLIETGFDILNPVQCSAQGMEPERLKKEFGDELVFWGGGVDTQKTLPFGKPEEVYREVRERIEIFSQQSGFVFNSIHNIQSNVPIENLLAMFRAIEDSRK